MSDRFDKCQNAFSLYKKALEIFENHKVPENDLNISIFKGDIAYSYIQLDKYSIAEEYSKSSLKSIKEVIGEDTYFYVRKS